MTTVAAGRRIESPSGLAAHVNANGSLRLYFVGVLAGILFIITLQLLL